jgi:hypothetical protein
MAMTVRAPTHIIPLWKFLWTIAGVGLEVRPSEIEATSDAEFSWTVDARPSWYPPHSIFQKRKGGLNYKFVNSAWTTMSIVCTAVIMLPATPPPIFKVTPAWDDEEVEHFEFGYWEREERAKKVRAFRIKCDHLRARVWEAVEHGDDNSIFLVIKHVEKDANIESMTDIIDPVTADGVTPVYKACRYGHPECARQLIVAGARPSRSTKTGSLTPLFGAAMGGHPACIELLLKQRDVRLEHRTTDGRTALYAAAEGGNRRCVELLIEAKAEVNTRRKDRSTPLIVASYFGHVEVVEVLLNAGARLKLKDEDGTALTNAMRLKQTAVVELLQAALKERGALESMEVDDVSDESM